MKKDGDFEEFKLKKYYKSPGQRYHICIGKHVHNYNYGHF